MPINIYEPEGNEVAWLCDDDWGLASQVYELEEWLKVNIDKLPQKKYIADIGYRGHRDAGGGGGVLTVNCMKMLVSVGMEVWLSEYPSV